MIKYLQPTSLSMMLALTFGVALHETKLDTLAVTSALPAAALVAYSVNDVASKFMPSHTHVERIHVGGSVASMQPRTSDDRKYVAGKRQSGVGGGPVYIWPSV